MRKIGASEASNTPSSSTPVYDFGRVACLSRSQRPSKCLDLERILSLPNIGYERKAKRLITQKGDRKIFPLDRSLSMKTRPGQ